MDSNPTITTTRLLLRIPESKDVSTVYKLANDPRVHRFMILPWPYKRANAKQFVQYAEKQCQSGLGYHFLVCSRSGNTVFGVIGLARGRKIDRNAEIGYWIGSKHWGSGIISDALPAVLQFAFKKLKLDRVWARSLPSNTVSSHILRKNGFVVEGTLRRHRKVRGRWHDEVQWGLLRSE